MVPETPVPAVADSGSRGNRVSLHKVSRHMAGVLSQVSAVVPRDVPHRVSLPRGAPLRGAR